MKSVGMEGEEEWKEEGKRGETGEESRRRGGGGKKRRGGKEKRGEREERVREEEERRGREQEEGRDEERREKRREKEGRIGEGEERRIRGKKRRGDREGESQKGGGEEVGVPDCQRLLEAWTIIGKLSSGTCSITSALRSLCRSCQPGGPWSTQAEPRPLAPHPPSPTNETRLVIHPHVWPSSVHQDLLPAPPPPPHTVCVWWFWQGG